MYQKNHKVMNKILFTAIFFTLPILIASAQIDNDDIALAQSLFGKTKRTIVKDYLEIGHADEAAFWNLYEAYEKERKSISSERFELIKEYAEKYNKLDERTAFRLANGIITNNEKINKLNKVYIHKFEKAVGGLTAATLFQIEAYLQTMMQAEIQSQIPLIGQLDKLKEN